MNLDGKVVIGILSKENSGEVSGWLNWQSM